MLAMLDAGHDVPLNGIVASESVGGHDPRCLLPNAVRECGTEVQTAWQMISEGWRQPACIRPREVTFAYIVIYAPRQAMNALT